MKNSSKIIIKAKKTYNDSTLAIIPDVEQKAKINKNRRVIFHPNKKK